MNEVLIQNQNLERILENYQPNIGITKDFTDFHLIIKVVLEVE